MVGAEGPPAAAAPPPTPLPPPTPPTPELSPSPPKQYSAEQAAALTLQLGLTRSMYNGLRTTSMGLVLPPHGKLGAAVQGVTPAMQELTVGTMSMCHVALDVQLAADIKHDPALRHRQHHRIKLGGDSATDMKEKSNTARSVLVLCYAWCDEGPGPGANSVDSHRITSAAWAAETPENVRDMVSVTSAELARLRKDGLMVEIDGVVQHHTFEFSLHGDYKWLRMVYGLGSPSSTFCCIYCDVEKSEIYEMLKAGRKDRIREKMRKLAGMHERGVEALAAKKKKMTSEEKEGKEEKRR